MVEEEYTIDDFCKRDKITPFTIVFDGEQLDSASSLIMSQLKTTETKCLTITERIVYYRVQQHVYQYKQKYDDTVRELLGICHQEDRVAYQVINDPYLETALLREIETEKENPLKFIDYFCRFKVEDEEHESFCNPNHRVKDVPCIRSYIESLNDNPYVVYYKKQRLGGGENLSRFCFENEHIIVKSLEAKIFVNAK